MTLPRAIWFLMLFGAVAVTVVGLRADQVRMASRIAGLKAQQLELRQASWSLQVEIARLRAPQQIRDRVYQWAVAVVEPRPPSDAGWRASLALAR